MGIGFKHFIVVFACAALTIVTLSKPGLATITDATLKKPYVHYSLKKYLNGKPALINILKVFPHGPNIVIKPSFGSYRLDNLMQVSHFAKKEKAAAAINASFFKPDTGAPLGLSIIDGEVITGPIKGRVVFGITDYNDFFMDKATITGKIYCGNYMSLKLVNINQPIMSKKGYTIYTDRWGTKTPGTNEKFVHIVVKDNKMSYIKQSSVDIPKGGFVIVGPHSQSLKRIKVKDRIFYNVEVFPQYWDMVRYAICGGPYLVKQGKMFIDRQGFNNKFLWDKAPRTAIGYTQNGVLLIVTVDGRKKGITEGATLSELAKIMLDLGAVQAMNLDGGTSTQMVVENKLVSLPTVKGGSRVSNALVIIVP